MFSLKPTRHISTLPIKPKRFTTGIVMVDRLAGVACDRHLCAAGWRVLNRPRSDIFLSRASRSPAERNERNRHQ